MYIKTQGPFLPRHVHVPTSVITRPNPPLRQQAVSGYQRLTITDELKDLIILPDGWGNHGSDDFPMSQGARLLPLDERADAFLIKYNPGARITEVVKINLIFWEEVLSPRKRAKEVGIGRSAESIRFISPGTEDYLSLTTSRHRLASRNKSKLFEKEKNMFREIRQRQHVSERERVKKKRNE